MAPRGRRPGNPLDSYFSSWCGSPGSALGISHGLALSGKPERRPLWASSPPLLEPEPAPSGHLGLLLQTHIWPSRANVSRWRVPPGEAPQVPSMPSRTPKAPDASFWACRFRFSAFSRKLRRVGKEGGIQGLGQRAGLARVRALVPGCMRGGAAGRPGRAGSLSAPPSPNHLQVDIVTANLMRPPVGCMWPAGLGALGSHCQLDAVGDALSPTDAKRACGSLSHCIHRLLAFLEGGRENKRRKPNNFSPPPAPPFFFFFCQSYAGKILRILSQS